MIVSYRKPKKYILADLVKSDKNDWIQNFKKKMQLKYL